MATYCDPAIESWECDADTWHSPKRDRVDRPDFARTARAVLEAPLSLEDDFKRAVAKWREDTENTSSFTAIIAHPSYQRIIDLGRRGEPVVPLILRDLKESGGFWAPALQSITNENPVAEKHIGNAKKVRSDWLEWGKSRGLL
jgi:hypothetical protein